MRLMTYNILTGGRDGIDDSRLAKACELIRGVQPDVLVLNECNGFDDRGFRTLYQVEDALGMRGVLAHASTGYHVALFVRGARIVETHCLDADVHHAVLAATLEVEGRRIVVVGAHLSPFGGEARLVEVQHLIRFLREDDAFVLGDLNSLSPRDTASCRVDDWLPRRRARHLLFDGSLPGSSGKAALPQLDTRAVAALEHSDLVDLFASPEGAFSPTALTRLCADWASYQVRIDHIFATRPAAERIVLRERVASPLAELASDHYPLFVDVRL
jgi:endonuclease/exonuclease/phosphatase family metal-dependent hydrolase